MLCSLIHNNVLIAARPVLDDRAVPQGAIGLCSQQALELGHHPQPGRHAQLALRAGHLGYPRDRPAGRFWLTPFRAVFAIGMIVIYDAAGVRRQAGIHAERINEMMKSLFEGSGIPEKELKEVLGHTPFEVITGVILGILISVVLYWLLPVNPATSC